MFTGLMKSVSAARAAFLTRLPEFQAGAFPSLWSQRWPPTFTRVRPAATARQL